MRDYRDAFPGLRPRQSSMVQELGAITDRIKCAVCGELCESTLHDTQDEYPERVFRLELEHHGAIERRELTMRHMAGRNAQEKFDSFVAPAFQQQARFRNRKDPGMLRFRRRRQTVMRQLGGNWRTL